MKKIFLILPLTLALLSGCNKNVFYAEEQDVDERGWNMEEALLFPVTVTDTTTVYNVLLDVRNSVNYDKANTFFFITTITRRCRIKSKTFHRKSFRIIWIITKNIICGFKSF